MVNPAARAAIIPIVIPTGVASPAIAPPRNLNSPPACPIFVANGAKAVATLPTNIATEPNTVNIGPAATATAPTSAVTVSKSVSDLSPTIRIYIDTTDLPRPVIVNYRQLYKRELKKLQEREPANAAVPQPNSALDSADDLFYRELLKKAEAYNVDDDDVDDDGSDDENFGVSQMQRLQRESILRMLHLERI